MDRKTVINTFVVILIMLCCGLGGYTIHSHNWTAAGIALGCFISALYLSELED